MRLTDHELGVSSSPPVDDNHQHWLKRQRGQEAGAVRLLERLRKRREVVVANAEAEKKYEERRREIEEAHRKDIAEARRQGIEDAQRWAAEEARRRAIEDARLLSIAEAQRKLAQPARSVLGERTNTATSNQAVVGPRSVETIEVPEWVPVPPPKPKSWPSVAPLPRPCQPAQYPPPGVYYSPRWSSREPQPPVPHVHADTTRAPIPMRPISSWQVDIERQGPPATHPGWHARTEQTAPREENLVDYMVSPECATSRSEKCMHANLYAFRGQRSSGSQRSLSSAICSSSRVWIEATDW